MLNLLIITFVFSFSTFGFSSDLVCPDGAYQVSFNMEFEPKKHTFCQSKINGVTVKHGPYYKYNSDGSIAQKKYYNSGKETEARLTPQVSKSDIKLPNLGLLLRGLIPDFSSTQVTEFSTKECDVSILKWGMLFMMKKPFKQRYQFKKDCDIEGEIKIQLDRDFPVNLKLNDFKNYTSVSMTLNISMDKRKKLTVSATNGVLNGPRKIQFSGNYSGRVRISSSALEFINAGGYIDVSQIDGQKVNIRQKIIIQ
jgi:hypothetical protein